MFNREDQGNGDERYGVSDRSIGTGVPIPSLFRRHTSGQFPPPFRPRRFHRKTHLRRLHRRRALLPIVWFILQSALPRADHYELRAYGVLSETMRIGYIFVSDGLPHWMVRD